MHLKGQKPEQADVKLSLCWMAAGCFLPASGRFSGGGSEGLILEFVDRKKQTFYSYFFV